MNRVFVRSYAFVVCRGRLLETTRARAGWDRGWGWPEFWGSLVSDLVLSVALLCITYIPLGCLAPQQWSFAPMS